MHVAVVAAVSVVEEAATVTSAAEVGHPVKEGAPSKIQSITLSKIISVENFGSVWLAVGGQRQTDLLCAPS